MPAIGSQSGSPEVAPVPHVHRGTAESFGGDVERYDRTRPRYPQALVDRIRSAAPGQRVLDVGSGTGIEARPLQAAGFQVLGVEPDQRMADFARGRGLATEVSTLEAWDAQGRVFDVVVAGTAWHWVDPVLGATKAAEVLRPEGLLTPFWHVTVIPATVHDALTSVVQRLFPDAPFDIRGANEGLRSYQPILDKSADGICQTGAFSEPEQWLFDWTALYTREAWLDYLPTTGILTRFPKAALGEVLHDVGEAIDQLGNSFTARHTTVALAATKTVN